MQRANGRQKQNSYRFKPRVRDGPCDEEQPSCSTATGNAQPGGAAAEGERTKDGVKKDAAEGQGQNQASTKPKESKSNRKLVDQPKPSSSSHDHESPGPSRKVTPKGVAGAAIRQPPPPVSKDHISTRTRSSSSFTAPAPPASPTKLGDKDKRIEKRSSDEKGAEGATGTTDDGWQVQRSRSSGGNPNKKSEASTSKQKVVRKQDPSTSCKNRLPAFSPSYPVNKPNTKQPQQLPQPQRRVDSATSTSTAKKPIEGTGTGPLCPDAISSTPKKKKKKPSVSKQEKQRRRDEAGLKELYKPKDSRVTLLDSDLFQKIKSNRPPPISSGVFQFSSTPMNSSSFQFTPQPSPSDRNSVTDFPTLESSYMASESQQQFKSFAAAAASPAIPLTPSLSSAEAPPPTSTSPSSPPSTIDTASTASASVKKPKLSKRSITVNLSELINTPKNRHPVGNLVADRKISRNKYDRVLERIRENHKLTVGNVLDSSGPLTIHRGKIKVKKKKASRLKKGILRSRALRKNSTSSPPSALSGILPENSAPTPPPTPPSLDVVTQQLTQLQLQPSIKSGSVFDDLSSLARSLPSASPSLDIDIEPQGSPQDDDNLFKTLLEEAEQSSKTPAPIPQSAIELVKLQLHSRKFRPYCDMFVTKELHGLVIPLMQELHRLQDRIYKTDPIKLLTKRRFVNGIKEVLSALKLKKVQMVILAPDIEPNSGDGGLDERTTEILSLAVMNKVPYLFSGNRYILGRCIKQTKSPVSAIAVLDKQSVEEQFNKILEATESLRIQYQEEFNRRVAAVMANGG